MIIWHRRASRQHFGVTCCCNRFVASDCRKIQAPDGWIYYSPGGLTPEQVERLIPKDCLIYNWFWKDDPGEKQGPAELNEGYLDKMGFKQIYW